VARGKGVKKLVGMTLLGRFGRLPRGISVSETEVVPRGQAGCPLALARLLAKRVPAL